MGVAGLPVFLLLVLPLPLSLLLVVLAAVAAIAVVALAFLLACRRGSGSAPGASAASDSDHCAPSRAHMRSPSRAAPTHLGGRGGLLGGPVLIALPLLEDALGDSRRRRHVDPPKG